MRSLRILIAALLMLLAASACQAQTINRKVVTFLEGKRGMKVGGGECAHAASEALRISGGKFIASELGADSPAAGDYVWGALVKVVAYSDNLWTDSSPEAKASPGDILQYNNTKIVSGTATWTTTHHTSIVAAVDTAGMPTSIYEQNFNQVRTVQKNPIDLTKLTAGWIRIYRPVATVNKVGTYRFSLVNNMPGAQAVSVKYSEQSSEVVNLTEPDTFASYVMQQVTTSSATGRFTLMLSNFASIQVENSAGYEVYAGKDGKAAIRKLTP